MLNQATITEAMQSRPVPTKQAPSKEALGKELEAVAKIMDSAFAVPGSRFRFGFDAILGLIPGVGDLATSLVSVYLLSAARRHGVSRITMARMASNVAIDFAVGAIPLFGDVFDFFWKSNERNVALLRRHASAKTHSELRKLTAADWLFVGGLVAVLLAVLAACLTVSYWIISALFGLLF